MNADPRFIAGTVAAEAHTAALQFRRAVSAREAELMTAAAELRAKLASAGSLAAAIKSLHAPTVDDLRTLIVAVYRLADGMTTTHDTGALLQALEDAAAVPVREFTADDFRAWAEDRRQDTLRAERREGVR